MDNNIILLFVTDKMATTESRDPQGAKLKCWKAVKEYNKPPEKMAAVLGRNAEELHETEVLEYLKAVITHNKKKYQLQVFAKFN